jgi:hypothetical protein
LPLQASSFEWLAFPGLCLLGSASPTNPKTRISSEAMARKVLEIAEREDYELTDGTLQFLKVHSPPVVQPTLPLW